MKKYIVCFLVILIFSLINNHSFNLTKVLAAEETKTENNIEKSLYSDLEEIDLSQMQDFYSELNAKEIFGTEDVKELIYNLISGKTTLNSTEIIQLSKNLITNNINSILKLVVTIVLVVAACKIASVLSINKSESTILNYTVLLIILSLIATVVTDSLMDITNGIIKVKSVMEVVSPILLSLLAIIGANGSTNAYSPVLVVLSGGVIEVIAILTTTITTLYFVLSIIGAITNHIKLDKFKSFLASFYKITIGFIFTIFIGYLSITGITSSAKDGISIKTAKFAIRSYLPIVGGYVSDSYELFRAGSVLIKNSIGVVAVIIIFGILISKIVSLLLYNLGFKLAGAIIEPMEEGKISKFLASLPVVFNFLFVAIMSIFMMCFISLIVIISTANLL